MSAIMWLNTLIIWPINRNINGTQFNDTFACNPVLGEDAPPDNSTIQISNEVERKALTGGLDCPDYRVGFPEPYLSQFDLAKNLN